MRRAPLFVRYFEPGLALARAVVPRLRAYIEVHSEPPKTIYLANHGSFATGGSAAEALAVTEIVVNASRVRSAALAAGSPRPLPTRVLELAARSDASERRRRLTQRARESNGLEVVFLDVGGPIYDDSVYASALLDGLWELGADIDEPAFKLEYDRCRHVQSGLTRPLAERFGVDAAALVNAAATRWRYPPEALHPDVLPALGLLAERYRVGVLANQPEATRAALERDGVAPYVELWVLSDEVGLAKPDPRIFSYAVEAAGCEPHRVVFVGNRLDNDVRPARAAGLRTVWLLRGEAPAEPTPGQIAESDAAIRSLAELPEALERLEPALPC